MIYPPELAKDERSESIIFFFFFFFSLRAASKQEEEEEEVRSGCWTAELVNKLADKHPEGWVDERFKTCQ